jgi:catechol 2,3-dioxygenase-like lactoylglutathione lyase family enzyme
MNARAQAGDAQLDLSATRFPPTAKQRGRIAPSKFAHVVYLTSHFEALIDWYKLVFEAQEVFSNGSICFLTYDDEHHRIAIIRSPELVARSSGTAGVHHVAYSFACLAELLATYERLKPFGIVPFWSVNHGPTTSLYYRDPDGNQMEFQVDNFESAALSTAYFSSEEFDQNPIGVEIDPDTMLRGLREGASEEELKKRPAGPASPIR